MADEVKIEEPQNIKVGEKEYSQEDLSRLVGLGETAVELETKWNTKIDKVYPQFTKTTQALSEREARITELEEQISKSQGQQTAQNGELTAEQRTEALRQLEALGVGPKAFETRQREIIREEMQANELLNSIDGLLSDAKGAGQPQTTPEELLKHMGETGIKNPTKAYKDMFETELDAIKEKKLAGIKPQGMVTTHGSQAGGKQPAPVAITKANLSDLVRGALGGE